MSDDIEKWLTDLEYGCDWQDFDLVLAEPLLLPRLQSYLASPHGSNEKKMTIISALVEMLADIHQSPNKEGQKDLANAIRKTIRSHSDIAELAISELGLVQSVTVQKLLGLSTHPEMPQWVLDAAAENCG